MAVLPNDIGLATATDVGNVANLNTQSKTVVEAINEVLQNAGSAAADQIYVEGDGNSIAGKGNIVFGNNNKVIGSGNVIVGDNLIVIGQDKKISAGLRQLAQPLPRKSVWRFMQECPATRTPCSTLWLRRLTITANISSAIPNGSLSECTQTRRKRERRKTESNSKS